VAVEAEAVVVVGVEVVVVVGGGVGGAVAEVTVREAEGTRVVEVVPVVDVVVVVRGVLGEAGGAHVLACVLSFPSLGGGVAPSLCKR